MLSHVINRSATVLLIEMVYSIHKKWTNAVMRAELKVVGMDYGFLGITHEST